MVAGNARSTRRTRYLQGPIFYMIVLTRSSALPLPFHTSWLNDLWRYDIETARFTCIHNSSDSSADGGGSVMETDSQVKGSVPSRRFGYVSVVHNAKLIIFGGAYFILWFGFSSLRQFDALSVDECTC